MLFSIGTRVRFKHTGDTGVITAQLDDGMLQIRLDDDPDFEIPAFEEDLERNSGKEPVVPGVKMITTNGPAAPEPPGLPEIKSQYHILKSMGLQLGFEPIPENGTVRRFKVWLINDTGAEFLIEFDLFAADENILGKDVKLNPFSARQLGEMLADTLNDAPEVEISCSRITTEGAEEPIFKVVKIKAKQFFNRVITAPILNFPVHHFILIDTFDPPKAESQKPETDLKTWTKTQVPQVPVGSVGRRNSLNHPSEFAEFEPEIDLHIQNLTNGYARLDKSQILRIQLSHFESFLGKAYRLGVSHVFVIHGVGEGKLKDAIAERLRGRPEVAKFKNEFHPRYGYGATEVIFR